MRMFLGKPNYSVLLSVDVCKTTFATCHTVLVLSHEDTGTTVLAFKVCVNDGSITTDLVVLEDSELNLLLPMSVLLGGGVGLLLVLLASTMKAHGIEEIEFS